MVERINRRFLWGATMDKRACSLVAWAKVCSSKEHDGLGFWNLHQVNLTALARLCWRVLHKPQELWVCVLNAKYRKIGDSDPLRPAPNCSHTWKSILQGFHYMRDGLIFQAANGAQARGLALPHWRFTQLGCFTSDSVAPCPPGVEERRRTYLAKSLEFQGTLKPFLYTLVGGPGQSAKRSSPFCTTHYTVCTLSFV